MSRICAHAMGLFSIWFLQVAGVQAQWIVSAYLGKSHTLSSKLAFKQPSRQGDFTAHQVSYTDRSFEFPLYYGVRVGYLFDFPIQIGVEEEFIHAKIYSNPSQVVVFTGSYRGEGINRSQPLGAVVQSFSISHGLNFLFTNLVAKVPINREQGQDFGILDLMVRVGIGPTIPHTESTIDNISVEQYQVKGPAYQIGTGLEIRTFWRIHVLLEYKFTLSELSRAKVFSGTVSSRFRTHHFVFGVTASL